MALAPVVLFAYNRPWHTEQTLMSLKNNVLANESKLFIYIDGPKAGATPEQLKNIEEVKQICKKEQWCKEVKIIEAKENKGLSAAVMSGVSEIVNEFGKVIVLEDDLVSDVYFLKFMNDTLDLYEKNEEVVSVTGYIYPVKGKLPETYFLKGADCWGWATWKRGWDLINTDGEELLKELKEKNLASDFDFYDSYAYTKMLEEKIEGKNNSWAILWYTSTYLANKLTLYPGNSLVQNIGTDNSGVHSHDTDKFKVKFSGKPIDVKRQELIENTEAKKVIADFFNGLKPKVEETAPPTFLQRIKKMIVG